MRRGGIAAVAKMQQSEPVWANHQRRPIIAEVKARRNFVLPRPANLDTPLRRMARVSRSVESVP
jgi:hypothetical protein